MRRPLLVGLVLVLVACGGGDADEPEGAASTTSTTATTAGGEAGEAGEPGEPGTSAATDGKSPSSASTPSQAGDEAAPADAVGARPGRYRYAVEGTATGGTPPTTHQHRDTATLTVSPPTGTDQRFDFTSPQGQGTVTLLRFDGGAVHIVELDLRGQLEKQFRPAQPVLAVEADPQSGDTWSWEMRSTDGTTTMSDDAEVVGHEQVSIAGQVVDTVRIHHDIRITTTFNGAPITATVDTTGWHSLDRALTVKEHTVVDVPGFIHDESTSTLQSLDPT